ncbi:MAG: hypothetical protein WBO45_01040 [Planctomycetota bacterium]
MKLIDLAGVLGSECPRCGNRVPLTDDQITMMRTGNLMEQDVACVPCEDADMECAEEPPVDDSTSECATCGRIFAGHGDDCGDLHTLAHREAEADGGS